MERNESMALDDLIFVPALHAFGGGLFASIPEEDENTGHHQSSQKLPVTENMTPIFAGLAINTPHGVGVVVCVRNDGMVVAKLGVEDGNNMEAGAGGPGFIGYFHPSSISPALPSPLSNLAAKRPLVSTKAFSLSAHPFTGSDGGVLSTPAAPSFAPSAVTVPPLGLFQPVSPTGMDCSDGDAGSGGVGGGCENGVTAMRGPPLTVSPLQEQQQRQQQQLKQHQNPQHGFVFQQQGALLRGTDRPCLTPPPSKRRRSAGGIFSAH